MADKSAIEWTDATWNPITGCDKVSQGCKHCYAADVAAMRWGHQYPRNTDGSPRAFTQVQMHEDRLVLPLRWTRPRRIFAVSMGDPFHPAVPDEFLDRMFGVMAACPQHTFQLLTKRPKRMYDYLADLTTYHRVGNAYGAWRSTKPRRQWPEWKGWPLPNVWVGTSVERQQEADQRVMYAQWLGQQGWTTFLSCEPLLAPLSLKPWLWPDYPDFPELPALRMPRETYRQRFGPHWYVRRWQVRLQENTGSQWDMQTWHSPIKWVIVGGESGRNARMMEGSWAADILDECRSAGVPYFMKQTGEKLARELGLKHRKGGDFAEIPCDLRVRQFPDTHAAHSEAVPA